MFENTLVFLMKTNADRLELVLINNREPFGIKKYLSVDVRGFQYKSSK